MPSFRHDMYIQLTRLYLQEDTFDSVEQAAQSALADRQRDQPGPPPHLSARITREVGRLGFPVYTVHPANGPEAQTPPIVYLHGGAYVRQIRPQHWTFAARLAQATGAQIIVPLYPLAPEHTWHDSHEQLLQLILDMPGPRPILMGDSAGGGLALALAAELRHEHGVTDLPGIVLFSPWVDLTMPAGDEDYAAADDPWLNATNLRFTGRLWAGSEDPADPRISPAYADLSDLPPTLFFSGSRDVLHGQVLDVAARLEASGTRCELQVGRGLVHVYPLLAVPEARAAFDTIVTFVSRQA
jgi:monoterpene epsilon-lactone hydrolase